MKCELSSVLWQWLHNSFIAGSRNTIVALYRTVPRLDPMTSSVKVIWPDGHTCIIGPWNETAEAHNIVFAFIDFSSESTRPYLASYSLSCISEECRIKIFPYCASYVKINSTRKISLSCTRSHEESSITLAPLGARVTTGVPLGPCGFSQIAPEVLDISL